MRFVSFLTESGTKLGVRVGTGILDVAAARLEYGVQAPVSIHELIDGGADALNAVANLVNLAATRTDLIRQEEELQLAPCVPNPQKILCIGLNYRRHALEVKLPIPTSPVPFSKFNNALTGSRGFVPMPADSNEVDYEAELAVVIGRKASDVSEADALDYVFGYCNANDLSARDLQFRTSQWLLGKTCDGFCPIGPDLVTADEVPEPNQLPVRCWVNGETRQDSNTADMIFSCQQIISYLSRYMTLLPGDIILTGTPEGVANGYPEEARHRYYLKSGDVVTVEIGNLGRLVNTLRA